jgi:glycosyltransferase involved in cell wall biosynthesis
MSDIYFVIPGDINTLTGGYAYDRELISGLTDVGYSLHPIQLYASFPFPDARALDHAVKQFAGLPDGTLVIVDGLAWGVLDSIAEKEASRLRMIALCHHPLMLETGLNALQAEEFFQSEKRTLLLSAAVIVTSKTTANIVREKFSIPAEKITLALPGTRIQSFAPCLGNPPVLLTIASITRRKGHNFLIDALAELQDLEWTARFVGGTNFDPQWVEELTQQIANYGLQKRILFLGNCVDVASEYVQADLFVLPSLFEGYGMAFAEALSFGLPIVAARAGAVPDVVSDTAGLLVPPADSHALAIALRSLLENSALRAQLQTGARSAAATLPRWQDTAICVDQLIQRLINSNHS